MIDNNKRFGSKFIGILMWISIFNITLYWCMRPIWLFVDGTLGYVYTSEIVFVLNILIGILFLYLYNKGAGRREKILLVVGTILLIILVGINFEMVRGMGRDAREILVSFKELSPYILTFTLVGFIVLYYEKLNFTKDKAFKISMVASTAIISLILIGDFAPVKITSGPIVQSIDSETYEITWTTNKNSVGWLEYGKTKESLKVKYSSEDGLINANSTLHKVKISKNDLVNSKYRICNKKIKDYYQNDVVYGNEVNSDFIEFKPSQSNTFYVFSDVHNKGEVMNTILSKGTDYDYIVLNGDTISSVEGEEQLVKDLLTPLTEVLQGKKVAYIGRGNHETRGAYTRDLKNYLSLPNDKYYYTFNEGQVFGIMLDTGEDKLDNHPEYGGLADFQKYREEQTHWLEEVLKSEEYKKSNIKIAYMHIPLNELSEDKEIRKYQEAWITLLNEADIDLVISGHTHEAKYIEPDEGRNFPIIHDGGLWTSYGIDFIASKVQVLDTGIKITFINENGNEVEELMIDK